jgi:hypothetical protein
MTGDLDYIERFEYLLNGLVRESANLEINSRHPTGDPDLYIYTYKTPLATQPYNNPPTPPPNPTQSTL